MSGNLEADRRDSLLDELARWRDRALLPEARLEIRGRRACSPMGVNARGVAQCSEGHGDFPDACNEAP